MPKQTKKVENKETSEKPSPTVQTKKRVLPKWLLPLVVLAVIGGALYYFKWLFIAVMVDGRPISHYQLVKELEAQGGKTVLDNLVDKSLIESEASKNKVTITATQIDDEIKKIEDQLKTQGVTLDTALASRGQTKDALKDQIKLQKTVEALVAPRVKLSDDDLKKYFDENKTVFGKDAKFDDVKESIRQQLLNEKLSTEYQTWITELRAKAKINYFLKF